MNYHATEKIMPPISHIRQPFSPWKRVSISPFSQQNVVLGSEKHGWHSHRNSKDFEGVLGDPVGVFFGRNLRSFTASTRNTLGRWTAGCFRKIGGKPPKWMVQIMENPIKMDDLEGKPTIFGNIHMEPTAITHLEVGKWSEPTPPGDYVPAVNLPGV